MLFVCHPKFCINIVKWPQEKLKTMLMQNFGVTNKEYYGNRYVMVFSGVVKRVGFQSRKAVLIAN